MKTVVNGPVVALSWSLSGTSAAGWSTVAVNAPTMDNSAHNNVLVFTRAPSQTGTSMPVYKTSVMVSTHIELGPR